MDMSIENLQEDQLLSILFCFCGLSEKFKNDQRLLKCIDVCSYGIERFRNNNHINYYSILTLLYLSKSSLENQFQISQVLPIQSIIHLLTTIEDVKTIIIIIRLSKNIMKVSNQIKLLYVKNGLIDVISSIGNQTCDIILIETILKCFIESTRQTTVDLIKNQNFYNCIINIWTLHLPLHINELCLKVIEVSFNESNDIWNIISTNFLKFLVDSLQHTETIIVYRILKLIQALLRREENLNYGITEYIIENDGINQLDYCIQSHQTNVSSIAQEIKEEFFDRFISN